MQGADHKQNAAATRGCQQVEKFLVKDALQDSVIKAETMFTGYLLEHNLPLQASAHAGPLFRKMFPDSEIAKKYGCGPTKTTAIVNYALAPSFLEPLVEHLRVNPFSLAIDGSSDTGTESMYPLVVRIYDVNRKSVFSMFWHMCLISDCTAKGIFAKVSEVFISQKVPWENVIGLSLDNAAVNMGRKNGLFRHFEKQNPSIYTFGCPCHIVHNAGSFASKVFTSETGFDINDFLVDIYYYFDNSTKRQAELKEFCEFCDQDYREILKFGATRWLSKEKCVDRVLQQYQSLRSYFESQADLKSDKRLARLKDYFASLTTEIYLLFYQSVLPVLSKLNLQLQNEEPQIHSLHQLFIDTLNTLAGRCVDIQALNLEGSDREGIILLNLDAPESLLPLAEVMIGFGTKNQMRLSNILPAEEKSIQQSCQKFILACIQYLRDHLPLKGDGQILLKHAEVLDVAKRANQSFDSVLFFIEKFPTLKTKLKGKLDELYDEFIQYKLLTDLEVASLHGTRVDMLWSSIGDLKTESGSLRFGLLFEVVKLLLVLPHSNAEEERIFTHIAKNKTKFRASLSLSNTLSSIVACKTNYFNKSECYNYSPSMTTLKRAKQAASTYNADHRPKSDNDHNN